uniref:Uncharacterized protein n=1 Tax=Ditylenchus dipsaci TaxID=166011 RepID=A0A915CZP4_9BILA
MFFVYSASNEKKQGSSSLFIRFGRRRSGSSDRTWHWLSTTTQNINLLASHSADSGPASHFCTPLPLLCFLAAGCSGLWLRSADAKDGLVDVFD